LEGEANFTYNGSQTRISRNDTATGSALFVNQAGSGDASLKAMRALLSTLTTEEDKIEVQGHIDARIAEIGASKKKTVTVDFSALPADLASKFAK
jgi:hypothetical protein